MLEPKSGGIVTVVGRVGLAIATELDIFFPFIFLLRTQTTKLFQVLVPPTLLQRVLQLA